MKYFVFWLLLLFYIPCWGQGENNIWIIGYDVGLNFNNSSPPQAFRAVDVFLYGTAVASDKNGNLLFFSDGFNVWDKFQNVMPHGKINDSAYIGGVTIVPFINDSNRYYLFVRDFIADRIVLYYSVIDISLNNGLGDIDTNFSKIILAENIHNLIPVKGDGCYVWLLTHDISENEFMAFKIDGVVGVHTTPVRSVSGFSSVSGNYISNMDIGTDNKTLAVSGGQNIIELDKFDNATGIVSDAVLVDQYFSGYARIHAICLSPDNTKLYVTGGSDGSDLIQYEIDKPQMPMNVIVDYEKDRSVYTNGQLRRGPDSKMYTSHWDGIFCINYPNLSGEACGFSNTCITLPDSVNSLGYSLGTDIVKVSKMITNKGDANLCNDKVNTLSAPRGFEKYEWYNGDTTQTIKFSDKLPAVWVKSVAACATRIDTFQIKYIPCDCSVHFPTAFTPNNDGLNEVFKVITNDAVEFSMKIYNRYGQMIFSSDNKDKGWDGTFKGKSCETTVYYYYARVKCNNNRYYFYKGDIQLLR